MKCPWGISQADRKDGSYAWKQCPEAREPPLKGHRQISDAARTEEILQFREDLIHIESQLDF